ncbi:hypothetical protein pb186bvf_014246 [Paramecium bursaria]
MDQQIKKQIKQKELFQPCPLHEREYLNIVCIDVICLNNGIICRICQSISHKAHGWFTLEDFIDILIKQEDDKTQLLNQEYQQLQDWFIKAKALDDQLKEIIDQIRRQLDHFKSFNQTIVDQIKSQITLCQMNSSIAARIKSNMILNVPNLQVFMNGLIQSFHSQYKPNYDNQQIQNLIDYVNLFQQIRENIFKLKQIQFNKQYQNQSQIYDYLKNRIFNGIRIQKKQQNQIFQIKNVTKSINSLKRYLKFTLKRNIKKYFLNRQIIGITYMRFKISQGNSNGGCGMETIRYKMNCGSLAQIRQREKVINLGNI